MSMSQKTQEIPCYSLNMQGKSVEEFLSKEWLLTNSRGGFASGTALGCNTRRYHGMLVGTVNPPANRMVALSNCLETVCVRDTCIEFSCFEFDKTFHPKGYEYLTDFRRDAGVHFDYELGLTSITKSLYLLPNSDVAALVYDFTNILESFAFSVRPLAALRDFHSLQNAQASLYSVWADQNLCIHTDENLPHKGVLVLNSQDMQFDQKPQWWRRFLYRVEQHRGQDHFEDLWSPGVFQCEITKPTKLVLWIGMSDESSYSDLFNNTPDIEETILSITQRQKELISSVKEHDEVGKKLTLAADQFIITRNIENHETPTILAGYPWFLDWGRDTFIALPGLCLSTGRIDDAAGVLCTFAGAVSEGMVPNRFDDYGNPPHYNSIDASMWFVHAAFEYLHNGGDVNLFTSNLLPAIRDVMDCYHNGTRFEIHADKDGLLSGGNPETQLTWMDAKCAGVTFTPRYGKTVEVNALWYSNLCDLSAFMKDHNKTLYNEYSQKCSQVKQSFIKLFWNEHLGYLNDCILPNGAVDTSLRPNQIYAVSLRHSALSPEQQKKVVDIVKSELLTEHGLRTLNRSDNRYIGRYQGQQFDRDKSYHQGTAWPFLMGGFVEAYLRVNNFSDQARKQCEEFLAPLVHHLCEDGCLGNISEIFDGDQPQYPQGCFAQAWSVAETLRAWKLIHS